MGTTTTAPARVRQAGIAHPAWASDEYSLPASDAAYAPIAATGSTWVELIPTWYQASVTSSTFAADPDNSVSDDGLRHAIRTAHAHGLSVLLKPHIDLPNDADRAAIHPADPAAWFATYQTFTRHYATLATQEHVDEYCVGTELAGTSTLEGGWRGVIAAVRPLFAGPITYAANYDEYRQIQFWDALDSIGIDAYFPLAVADAHDPALLTRAWTPIVQALADLSEHWQRPILFTEAGYTSQRGTTAAPYDWAISKTRDDREQAAGYEALLRSFWHQPWFAGVFWWMWDDIPGRTADDQSLDYTPHTKPAEAVLRAWWKP